MKRALLPFLLTLPLLHIGACSSEDVPVTVPGAAGTSSPGTSGSGPVGGTDPGTAGTGTTGGTPQGGSTGEGTAGTPPGTGGSETAGGSTGTTGGAGGSAGTTGGSTATTGGSGGAGGSTGGSGMGGSAGSATGGGGAGTGGTAPAAVSVGKLDGMLIMTPCADTNNSDDCNSNGWIYEGKTTACVGGKLDSDAGDKTVLDFPVTGEKGKRYIATMHFYGIMEPKNYGNRVTREAGTRRPNNAINPSTPEGFAYADGGVQVDVTDYNNYEIHVIDDTGKEIKQYFINSDTQQGHYTFAINYERPIEIVGGGKVHVRVFDNNCRMIKNCNGGPTCNDVKARKIDISAANPQPTTLMQPGMGRPADQSGQWFLIDVKNIVAK